MLINNQDYLGLSEYEKRRVAAQVVIDLVNEFGTIGLEQVVRITGLTKSFVRTIAKYKKFKVTEDETVYYSLVKTEPSETMLKALEVLAQFSPDIDWYSSGIFPIQITFCRNGKVYDVCVMGIEDQLLIKPAITRLEYENLYLVLDNKEQMKDLSLQANVWYLTVNPIAMLGANVEQEGG